MVHKCTFPVQANRFLRFQVFAPSPPPRFFSSLVFSLAVLLSEFDCVTKLILPEASPAFSVFEVDLHRKRIPKSMKSNLLSSPPLHSKLKKIQGLFKALHTNSRTFQGKMEFKDFSRTPPKIQGLLKTVRTLKSILQFRDL